MAASIDGTQIAKADTGIERCNAVGFSGMDVIFFYLKNTDGTAS